MVRVVEERLCHAFCHAFPKPPWKDLLVFNESVDVILGSVFTCGNFENKSYTEQGLLGVTVRHHLQGKQKQGKNVKVGKYRRGVKKHSLYLSPEISYHPHIISTWGVIEKSQTCQRPLGQLSPESICAACDAAKVLINKQEMQRQSSFLLKSTI